MHIGNRFTHLTRDRMIIQEMLGCCENLVLAKEHLRTPAVQQHSVLGRHQKIAGVFKGALFDTDRGKFANCGHSSFPDPTDRLRSVILGKNQVALA